MGRRESKYCEKCGCYLPEGETVCVSCGYDPIPKLAPISKPSSELTIDDFDTLIGTYSRYHTVEHKEVKRIPRRPDPLAAMYARDPWAVAQYHTPLPMDYAQMVNVAPRVRQRTLDEVLDAMKTENAYAEATQAMNQTNCSTTQAVEAFAQLAQDHRDAWKQVMLHDALWAKGGKGNPRTVVTPNCIKGHMDSNCTRYCDCCYLEKEEKDKYTPNIIRIYRCKKYPHRSYIGTIN